MDKWGEGLEMSSGGMPGTSLGGESMMGSRNREQFGAEHIKCRHETRWEK